MQIKYFLNNMFFFKKKRWLVLEKFAKFSKAFRNLPVDCMAGKLYFI